MYTAEATHDSVNYVRNAAMNGFWKLLSDAHEHADDVSGSDLTASVVLEAMVHAKLCDLDADARCAYYKIVAMLVRHYGNSLRTSDMEIIMANLVNTWQSQRYDISCSSQCFGNGMHAYCTANAVNNCSKAVLIAGSDYMYRALRMTFDF